MLPSSFGIQIKNLQTQKISCGVKDFYANFKHQKHIFKFSWYFPIFPKPAKIWRWKTLFWQKKVSGENTCSNNKSKNTGELWRFGVVKKKQGAVRAFKVSPPPPTGPNMMLWCTIAQKILSHNPHRKICIESKHTFIPPTSSLPGTQKKVHSLKSSLPAPQRENWN